MSARRLPSAAGRAIIESATGAGGARDVDSETFIMLSGALSFGAPLALAVRELVVLRRDDGGKRGGGSWKGDPVPDTPPRFSMAST